MEVVPSCDSRGKNTADHHEPFQDFEGSSCTASIGSKWALLIVAYQTMTSIGRDSILAMFLCVVVLLASNQVFTEALRDAARKKMYTENSSKR